PPRRRRGSGGCVRDLAHGPGTKDDQDRAGGQPAAAPSRSARDADRARSQQNRPHARFAGYAGDPRHDPQGATPGARGRRREVRGHATMKLNQIADKPGSRKKRMRIGRGIGSGMGKTGGRGGKGQTARTGVRIKGFEGGQMPLHRRLPKRGFRNTSFAVRLNEINLGKVQAAIDAGLIDAKVPVDAAAMVKAVLRRREKGGVKLLGDGELKSKVEFSVWRASKSAVAAVEKAGGTVKVLAPAKEADAEPEGKNKRKTREAAKGADKPKGGKPKEPKEPKADAKADAEAEAPKAE